MIGKGTKMKNEILFLTFLYLILFFFCFFLLDNAKILQMKQSEEEESQLNWTITANTALMVQLMPYYICRL